MAEFYAQDVAVFWDVLHGAVLRRYCVSLPARHESTGQNEISAEWAYRCYTALGDEALYWHAHTNLYSVVPIWGEPCASRLLKGQAAVPTLPYEPAFRSKWSL